MDINKPIPKFFILLLLINLPFLVFWIDAFSEANNNAKVLEAFYSFFGCINVIFLPLLLLNCISEMKANNNRDNAEKHKKIISKSKSYNEEEKGNIESNSEQYSFSKTEASSGINYNNQSEIDEKNNYKDIKKIGFDKRPEKVKSRADEDSLVER